MQRDLPSHNTAKKRKGKLWLEGWPSVSRRGSNSPFLELRDSVCVTARCLRDCGRKASDSLSLMFNSAGGKASVQNAALALCSAEPAEEGTEITPPPPSHGTVSFIHLLRLPLPCSWTCPRTDTKILSSARETHPRELIAFGNISLCLIISHMSILCNMSPRHV